MEESRSISCAARASSATSPPSRTGFSLFRVAQAFSLCVRECVLVPAFRNHWRLLATASAVTGFCLLGASDPLTDLKAGSTAIEGKRYAAAVTLLEPLIKKLPKLADYSGWFLANAQFSLRNYAGVQTAKTHNTKQQHTTKTQTQKN